MNEERKYRQPFCVIGSKRKWKYVSEDGYLPAWKGREEWTSSEEHREIRGTKYQQAIFQQLKTEIQQLKAELKYLERKLYEHTDQKGKKNDYL